MSFLRARSKDVKKEKTSPPERKAPVAVATSLESKLRPSLVSLTDEMKLQCAFRACSPPDDMPLARQALYIPDASVVASMRMLLGSEKVYRFRMTAAGFGFATGAGTSILTYAAFSPGVTTFAEWSTLAALFDEVVLEQAHLEVTSSINRSATSAAGSFAVATDHVNNGVNPGSYTAVFRLADARSYSIMDWGRPVIVHNTGKITKRPWASTGAPVGDGDPPCGMAGQFSVASSTLTTGTTYLMANLVTITKFRNRA